MRYTPESRTAKILAVRARLASGESLAKACTAEELKPTTFIAWMRRFGPLGEGGKGYPRSISRSAVLGSIRDRVTMGGPGSSFNAWVTTRLVAEFDAKKGLELWFDSSSYSAWLSDTGRRAREGFHGGVGSIDELVSAVKEYGDAHRWLRFCPITAAEKAREAFPWLPERIERGDDGAAAAE